METPSSSISIDSSTGKSSSSSLWKPKLNSVWWRLVIESCGWKEICSRPTTAEAYNEQEGTWIFTIYLEVGSVQYIYMLPKAPTCGQPTDYRFCIFDTHKSVLHNQCIEQVIIYSTAQHRICILFTSHYGSYKIAGEWCWWTVTDNKVWW